MYYQDTVIDYSIRPKTLSPRLTNNIRTITPKRKTTVNSMSLDRTSRTSTVRPMSIDRASSPKSMSLDRTSRTSSARPMSLDRNSIIRPVDANGRPISSAELNRLTAAPISVDPIRSRTLTSKPSIQGYQIQKELGRGAFGVTYLALNPAGQQVAIKQIPFTSETDRLLIEEEVSALQAINQTGCQYVVCYEGVIFDDQNAYIVTEYLKGQELFKYMQANPVIKPQLLRPLMLQLILGLKQIHDAGFAHRDIKPENIILADGFVAKYIDFGLACYEGLCDGPAGTIAYMSPEMLVNWNVNRSFDHSMKATQAHDIWSLAVIFYEFANGLNSLGEVLYDAAFNFNYRFPKANYRLDAGEISEFIDWMMQVDPKLRPNITEVLGHFIQTVLTRPF